MPRTTDISNADQVLEAGRMILSDTWPGWTFERLLCHPMEAVRFCGMVRDLMGVSHLADDEILWSLLNQRKKGQLNQREAACT